MEKQNSKVLILGDALKNGKWFGEILKKENFDVAYSNESAEAFSMIQECDFNIAIIDLKSSGPYGFQFCHELRSIEKTKDIPVIFLTSFAKQEIEQAYECGGDDFLFEPFKPSELVEKIKIRLILRQIKDEISKKHHEESKDLIQLRSENDKMRQEIDVLKEKNKSLIKIPSEYLKLKNIKNNFLRIICHELRTPVSGILGFTEILKENPSCGENEDILETIIYASNKIKEYSDTALMVSEIDPEHINENMRPTKLSSLLDYALSDVMNEFRKKGIRIDTNLIDELSEIIIEPGLIKNVIQIVLSNAVTYSPENGLITIKLNEFRDRVELEICDQGCGFPPEKYRLIKDFFMKDVLIFRSEWPGMHFAIIKYIMDFHNGQVEIENCNEGGALVKLIFPINSARGRAIHQALSQLN